MDLVGGEYEILTPCPIRKKMRSQLRKLKGADNSTTTLGLGIK